VTPVSVEFWHFLGLVEMWLSKFLSPEWSIRISVSFTCWLHPSILDLLLIVKG